MFFTDSGTDQNLYVQYQLTDMLQTSAGAVVCVSKDSRWRFLTHFFPDAFSS